MATTQSAPGGGVHVPARETVGGTGLGHWWAERGYPVFGISATAEDDGTWRKRPCFRVGDDDALVADDLPYLRRTGPHSGGYHQATLDPKSIRHVVTATALVATPGPADVFCIDIDDAETFAGWVAGVGDVWTDYEASTFRVATRGNGDRRHVYVRVPMGVKLGKLRIPGADAKGVYTGTGHKSGYWVLPSAERPDGGAYTVVSGSPDPADIPVASPLLIDALRRAAPAVASVGRRTVSLRPSTYRSGDQGPEDIGIGERNDYLFRRGCRFAKMGDFGAVLEMLHLINARFSDPHTDAEVERAARSCWERTEAERAKPPEPREPEPAPESEPAPEQPGYPPNEVGLRDGAERELGVQLGHASNRTLLVKPDGEPWQTVKRGDPLYERLFLHMGRRCRDQYGGAWSVPRHDMWAMFAAACLLRRVPVEDAYEWKTQAVTAWANGVATGNYTYGEVAHKAGIVDRFKGGENLSRVELEIIRAGLAAADGEWKYKEVRLPDGRHGPRFCCPRRGGADLTGRRANLSVVRGGRT